MPYIKQVDRTKFKNIIETVVKTIAEGNEPLYIKGEYFGFFVNRLAKRFLGTTDYINQAFNSAFFNESKQKTLANSADKASALLNRADPLSCAGELNYTISAIYWGILGEAEGVASASYGMRAYLRRILSRIASSLETATVNQGSQRDATMTFRRHLIIGGVLDDVIEEAYRRFTADYERQKLLENGEIWVKGKLNVPEGDE